MDWPENLVLDLARRRVVLVVGSGVSAQSVNGNGVRPPTWKKFLEAALQAAPGGPYPHIERAISDGDFLHACEWLKGCFDENWVGYLRAVFAAPQFPPAAIHEALTKLDSRIVFSLNFDNLYERQANSIFNGAHIVKNYYDDDVVEFLRGDGRYIVKLHGSLDSPERLIFTHRDYANARIEYSGFYKAFDACLLSHSFVFVGCGYSDPDINLLLENNNFSFPSGMPHYFLTGEELHPARVTSLRNNRNLKVIRYEPIDEQHSGLVPAVAELVDLVDGLRAELAVNANW